jgi:small subunit ribosomal protein S16
MEVRIRLQKAGKVSSGAYNYRIVAIPRQLKRDGAALEILGYYDPAKKPAALQMKMEKIEKWVSRGAVMSDTVASLVRQTKRVK